MASRTELELYRRRSIRAAKDFCYGTGVVESIEAAKTIGEIERIMVAARKRKE